MRIFYIPETGIRTLLMAWRTPLLPVTSGSVTLASLTVTCPCPSTLISIKCPSTVVNRPLSIAAEYRGLGSMWYFTNLCKDTIQRFSWHTATFRACSKRGRSQKKKYDWGNVHLETKLYLRPAYINKVVVGRNVINAFVRSFACEAALECHLCNLRLFASPSTTTKAWM